ncbi:MAG TPA: xanthine dehydrogenase family protein subunit M [Candidatus Limnocylindria bacterium]|nr:xanthine dehydrogenase family protein subunit M [Candidatus Limnocylindria bacterium]
MKPFAYARPRAVTDALELVRGGATVMAGGTDLLGLMKDGITAPERIVDIRDLEPLRGWARTKSKGLRIGALVPLAELETSAELAKAMPIIGEALRPAATLQLRTMGTVGGNLLQRNRCWYFRDEAYPCWLKGGVRCFAVDGDNRLHAIVGAEECVAVAPSDLAPALIAYDATVSLAGSRGTRTMPLVDLFVTPHGRVRREHAITSDELIVEVRVPENALARRGAFEKAMERKTWSFALVSVAVSVKIIGGVARDARIVLGGVAPVPWRARDAEKLLEGRVLDDAACQAAADAALERAEPLKDNGYKVPLGRELVRRTLRRLA